MTKPNSKSAPAVTLVERARALPQSKKTSPVSDEEVDLILAYLRGEVNGSACSRALGMKHQNIGPRMANGLRLAIGDGRVTIERANGKK